MITLRQYILQCLKNEEFAYYWGMDNLELPDEEKQFRLDEQDDDVEDLMETLNITVDDVIKNRGIDAAEKIKSTVKFYETDSRCPVAEFLDEIKNQQLKEKTVKNMVKLAELGSNARPPLSEYIGDGIYELRTQSTNNITRVFFFFIHGSNIIFTNGYIKKSQKMDPREFKKAKQYRDEYSRRFN